MTRPAPGPRIRTAGVPARRPRSRTLPAEESRTGTGAATALLALALVSPWAFGGTPAGLFQVLCGLALLVAALAALRGAVRRDLWRPDVPVWPVLGLLSLGVLQVVPLPDALLAVVAPGSHAVWRPESPAALAVLGEGPVPVSVDPAATWRWVAWAAALASLTLLAAPGWRRARSPERRVALLLGGVVAVAVYGVFARQMGGELIYGRFPVLTTSPFGPFVSKNHFAGYVALGVPLGAGLAVGLAARSRESGWRGDWTRGPEVVAVVAALLASLALGFAVFVSLSRGGVLNVCLGAAFFGATWWWRSRRVEPGRLGSAMAAAAAAALAAAVLAGALPEEAWERVGSVASPDSSGEFRLRTWRAAIDAAGSSPALGQGFGAFADAFPRFKEGDGALRVTHAENDYLEILVEAGGVGLLLAVLAVGLGLWRAFVALLATRDGMRAGLGLGALGGLAGLAAHSALDFNLRIPSNALLAATLAAIALGSARLERRAVAPLVAGVWSAGLVAGLVLLAIAPGGSWPEARALARRAGEGAAPSDLRLERAEDALREAVRERPALAETWLLLAWTRAARGGGEATDLARWAVALDPRRADLQREAERLGEAPAAATPPPPPDPEGAAEVLEEPGEATAEGDDAAPEPEEAPETEADEPVEEGGSGSAQERPPGR